MIELNQSNINSQDSDEQPLNFDQNNLRFTGSHIFKNKKQNENCYIPWGFILEPNLIEQQQIYNIVEICQQCKSYFRQNENCFICKENIDHTKCEIFDIDHNFIDQQNNNKEISNNFFYQIFVFELTIQTINNQFIQQSLLKIKQLIQEYDKNHKILIITFNQSIQYYQKKQNGKIELIIQNDIYDCEQILPNDKLFTSIDDAIYIIDFILDNLDIVSQKQCSGSIIFILNQIYKNINKGNGLIFQSGAQKIGMYSSSIKPNYDEIDEYLHFQIIEDIPQLKIKTNFIISIAVGYQNDLNYVLQQDIGLDTLSIILAIQQQKGHIQVFRNYMDFRDKNSLEHHIENMLQKKAFNIKMKFINDNQFKIRQYDDQLQNFDNLKSFKNEYINEYNINCLESLSQLAFQIVPQKNLTKNLKIQIQVQFEYQNQQLFRIFNRQIKITNSLDQVYDNINFQIVLKLLVKQCNNIQFKDYKKIQTLTSVKHFEVFQERVMNILKYYSYYNIDKFQSLHQGAEQLISFLDCLRKSNGLRNSNLQKPCFRLQDLYKMQNLSPENIQNYIYPMLFNLTQWQNQCFPEQLNLSSQAIERQDIHVFFNGIRFLVYVPYYEDVQKYNELGILEFLIEYQRNIKKYNIPLKQSIVFSTQLSYLQQKNDQSYVLLQLLKLINFFQTDLPFQNLKIVYFMIQDYSYYSSHQIDFDIQQMLVEDSILFFQNYTKYYNKLTKKILN